MYARYKIKIASYQYRNSRWGSKTLHRYPLQWRHNEQGGVSNHHHHDCLLNRLFMRRSKKTPKLRVTGICEGNSPVTGKFPAQRASNAENISIWWRQHDEWSPSSSESVNSWRPSDAYMRQYTWHHWFRERLVTCSAPSVYLNRDGLFSISTPVLGISSVGLGTYQKII